MNTKTNTYRVNERKLVPAQGAIIALQFDGVAKPIETTLEEIPAVLKKEGLRTSMPRRVTINGMKGGAFPCLMAKSEVSAALMSGRCGYKVDKDDGLSFATQASAGKFWSALRDLGVNMSELVFEWRVGSTVETAPQQIPLNLNTQLSELAQEESPFG